MNWAFRYVERNRGISKESFYEYEGVVSEYHTCTHPSTGQFLGVISLSVG